MAGRGSQASADAQIAADLLAKQRPLMEWEYRVIAVNRAGEGMESSVMTAVL